MKRVIIILSLFVACAFSSFAQECDTLKWKSLKSNYANTDFHVIGILDSTTINIDTLPAFVIEYVGVNISNDTFFAGGTITIASTCLVYADTGYMGYFPWKFFYYIFDVDFSPNDTFYAIFPVLYDLPSIINSAKVELEEISYWKVIIGVSSTSKDGYYPDSVFYAGADTSIFYVVRGGVSVEELTIDNGQLTVYPNPTSGQLKITNYETGFGVSQLREGSVIEIYNVVGQKLLSIESLKSTETTIDVQHLANGMYFLKIGNQVVRFVKE